MNKLILIISSIFVIGACGDSIPQRVNPNNQNNQNNNNNLLPNTSVTTDQTPATTGKTTGNTTNNGTTMQPGTTMQSGTTTPIVCGDGSDVLCNRIPPVCPTGQIAEIKNGCYGECVDDKTCKPVRCGDGSLLTCKMIEPSCPKGQIAEIKNGCYGKCVDKTTCKPRFTKYSCGPTGTICGKGQFCNYTIKEQCGGSFGEGKCETFQIKCIILKAPVCGCDGNTYNNQCLAQASQVSVKALGKCTIQPK